MKNLVRRIRHFFFARRGNKFKPGLFAKEWLAAIALVLFLVEGAYVMQVQIVLKNTGFLASVLPAALTSLTNSDRTAQGLSSLTEDVALNAVAQAKANDMAEKGYFAHVSPDGRTPWSWLDAANYSYTYAGENLAVDFTDSADVEDAWMKSPLHRANILKTQYRYIGIGVARGMYKGKEVTFIAQFFAAKAVRTVSRPSTGRTPAAVSATQSAVASATPTKVLGEEVVPKTTYESVAVLSTSPTRTITYVILSLVGLIAFFFILALFTHARRKLFYTEVLFGGLAIIGLAVAIVLYNGSDTGGLVPQSGQAASVALTL